METKLIDLGVKNKDIYAETAPKSEKDYEKEKRYPELDVHGPHAEMLGAEDLKEGDLIEQTVRWRVKRHSATTENGKTDYRMTLCMEKASDCKECESGDEDDGEENEEQGESEESPGLAYITSQRASKGE